MQYMLVYKGIRMGAGWLITLYLLVNDNTTIIYLIICYILIICCHILQSWGNSLCILQFSVSFHLWLVCWLVC